MSQINPFTASIVQSPQVQRQHAADKDRQIREAQGRIKNSAFGEDHFDHQVENSDAISPIHEEQKHDDPRRRKNQPHRENEQSHSDDDSSGLDLTA